MPPDQTDPSQFRLWQLLSPTLPVGAYAYSQGLEYAIELQWVKDRDSAFAWIGGLLKHNLGAWELPILIRQYHAFTTRDTVAAQHWNRLLLSSRESKELWQEDLQMGQAMRRLLDDLGLTGLDDDFPGGRNGDLSYVTAFAFAAQFWRIPLRQVACGLAWSWCENQVAAAIKLVPLGQTDGQRLLLQLADTIPAVVANATLLADDDIGAASYGLAMASAFHEEQYSRLFRS